MVMFILIIRISKIVKKYILIYYDYYFYDENYYHHYYNPSADLIYEIYYKYYNDKDDNFDKITNTFKAINFDSSFHTEHDGYSYHGYSYFSKY